MASLAAVPGVQDCIAFKKAREQNRLADVIGDFPIIDLGGRLDFGSFVVTPAAMCNLDLIVSCDTSCVHLAGTMGLPVWAASPGLGMAAGLRGGRTAPGIRPCRHLQTNQARRLDRTFRRDGQGSGPASRGPSLLSLRPGVEIIWAFVKNKINSDFILDKC